FYDDVYATIRDRGGDIFVHNVDETLFLKWLGDKKEAHRERMSRLGNFNQKIILCEGDTNFAVDFAKVEYRWLPEEEFSSVPFYIYGPKLALITFEDDDVGVFILHQDDITSTFRKLFSS